MAEAPAVGKNPSSPDEQPKLEGAELIDKVADKRAKLSSEETLDALEWFLSDEEDNLTKDIELNVGSSSDIRWITWTIKPVDLDTLKRIRRMAQDPSNRAQRRSGQATGEVDENDAALRIVVAGTASPDLTAITKEMGYTDPSDVLKHRFRHKPGLIVQISGEIMGLSGYDDDDIKDVDAAGN